MPHGYSLDIDDDKRLQFSKQHKNGEVTTVEITNRIPGEDWEVQVTDPRGSLNLGKFGTKTEARRQASQWMKDNPKGVPASGKDISGAGGGIPGMNGNGLF